MQALHARRGSITFEHSRGFVREFGRRAIARRWGQPMDKGSLKAASWVRGIRTSSSCSSSSLFPALDCLGGESPQPQPQLQ